MYGTSARNSSTRPAFSLIALENRLEKAQVHRSSVKTCGSSCGYCARMEACSLLSLSCIEDVACLAGEPSKYWSSSSDQVKVAETSSTEGKTLMYSLQKELGFWASPMSSKAMATYSLVSCETMPLSSLAWRAASFVIHNRTGKRARMASWAIALLARRPRPESSPSSSSKVEVAKAREWGGSFHPLNSDTHTSLLSSHLRMASFLARLSASALPRSLFCHRDASCRSKPPPA